eukprot:6523746-Heterocapsa_arctica.AAC.1
MGTTGSRLSSAANLARPPHSLTSRGTSTTVHSERARSASAAKPEASTSASGAPQWPLPGPAAA